MPAQLVLKNGRVISLTDDAFERVLRIVEVDEQTVREEPAQDLETLMSEFQDFYGSRMPSVAELLEERDLERSRERSKLGRVP